MRKALFMLVVVTLSPLLVHAQYSWQSQFPSLPSFSYPVELIFARDGTNRVFVVQQFGVIYVFQNDAGVSTRKVFLDISDRVSQDGGETGLLGLAFHPHYPDSAYFYVDYVRDSSGVLTTRIARYTVSPTNPDSALHDSEKILLTVSQPYPNHKGGKVAFGPDGYLYIGFGDGGSGYDPGNRGQDLTTILAKIIRINVDSSDSGLNYSIPPTNPFYHNGSGYREEIYAYGVRNPWRFSFDNVTGTLWLGDVGQDTREEVDTVINGGNYGWRLKEGFICTPSVNPTCQDTAGLLSPVWDYPHNGSSKSITGGYVYRGSAIPSLYGEYIFADYVTGETWTLTTGGGGTSVTSISDESYLISTFGQDPDGNVYLCSYGSSGQIYKLVDTSVVLSVDMSALTVKGNGLQATIHWRTEGETNIFGFSIERSRAELPNEWNQVAFLQGSGSMSVQREYEYVDHCPSPGKYFYRIKRIDSSGAFGYSSVVSIDVGLVPTTLILGQNFPNPFNPSTTIEFGLPARSYIRLRVFNVLGQVVADLVTGDEGAGYHSVVWNASVASGIYLYRVEATSLDEPGKHSVLVRKLLLLK